MGIQNIKLKSAALTNPFVKVYIPTPGYNNATKNPFIKPNSYDGLSFYLSTISGFIVICKSVFYKEIFGFKSKKNADNKVVINNDKEAYIIG